MAKGNDSLTQAINLIKQSKWAFNGGLTQTDNDDQHGTAANIQNMEIEHGIAVKRRGSILLNDGDVPQDYYLLKNIFIGGSELLIGVDHNRYIVAFFKHFPAKKMIVFKSHFYRNKRQAFTKGVKFFLVNNPRGYTIVNEFGEAKTIFSNGILKIAKGDSAVQTYYPRDEIDREEGEYRLYLDIVEATNYELDSFFISYDGAKDTIPLKGDVRCAYVNEAGVVSKMSDSQPLQDYHSVVVGMEELQTIESDTVDTVNDRYLRYITEYVPVSIGRSDIGSSNDIASFLTNPFTTTQNDVLADAVTIDEVNTEISTVNTSSFTVVATQDASGNLTFKPLAIFGGAGQLDTIVDAEIAKGTGAVRNRFYARIIGRLKDVKKTFTGAPIPLQYTDFEYVGDDDVVMEYVDIVFSISNYIEDAVTVMSFSDDTDVYVLNNMIVDTTTSAGSHSIRTSSIRLLSNTLPNSRYAQDSGFTYSNRYSVNTDIQRLNEGNAIFAVEIFFDLDNDEFIECKGITPEETRMDNLVKHLGYDTWEIDSISEGVKIADSLTSFWQTMASSNLGNVSLDEPFHSKQFVVWNENNLVSKSQSLFLDQYDNILYRVTDTLLKKSTAAGAADTYTVNQCPATGITESYLSFTKPIYQSLRRVPYLYNPNIEVLRDVKDIATNNILLCAIRSNRLWIGRSDTLLLDSQIELAGHLFCVSAFSDGFVVFTSAGAVHINGKLETETVRTLSETRVNIIKCQSNDINNAVYAISDTGSVMIIFYEFMEKVPILTTRIITDSIHAVHFSQQSEMVVINGAFYISDGDTIYGYKDNIWFTKMKFDGRVVRKMASLDSKLVIFFYDEESDVTIDFSESSEGM